jgi:hypothetical protein
MEGMPKPPKPIEATDVEILETDAPHEESIEETVQTPEYWKEKQEIPFSAEYIEFQIRVLREIANKSGKPFVEISEQYGTIIHPYIWPDTENYIDMEKYSDEEIIAMVIEKERQYSAKQPPTKYHDGNRYGCFSYMQNPNDGIVDIHFSNAEFDEKGPLQFANIEHRLHELHDMFAAIKREHPDATEVRGNSWLYNVDAYKRLFPDNYTSTLGEDLRDHSLATGRAWGQFADNKLGLKEDVAAQFLKNIQALEEITPDSVRSALPYHILQALGSIEDFYKKYAIA